VAYLDHAAVLHILLTGFAVPSVRLSLDKTTLNVGFHPSGGAVVLFQDILIMICCNAEAKRGSFVRFYQSVFIPSSTVIFDLNANF
jgi:hypothetical protein